MPHSEMEFPKPADFEEGPSQRGPRITGQRMGVLGLLLVGGALLGLATQFWPRDGKMPEWLAPFQNVALQDPDAELRREIIANFSAGNVDQSLLLSEKLIERDPSAGYELRGQIYLETGDFTKAEADFTQVIEKNPQSIEAYLMRLNGRLRAKQLDKALEDAAAVTDLDARQGNLITAAIYEEMDDMPKAIKHYTKAIEADPAYAQAYSQRYQAYLASEQFEEALKDAEKLTELAPAQGYILQGDAQARMGKSAEAIESYGKALGHDPLNATALNNRAYHRALFKTDLDEAVRDINEAIEIAGENAAFVDTRGYIAYLRGDFKQALADFNKALGGAEEEPDPGFGEIYFHRALVYRKLSEPKLAEQDFEKAKKLGFKWDEEPEPVAGNL